MRIVVGKIERPLVLSFRHAFRLGFMHQTLIEFENAASMIHMRMAGDRQ